MRNEVVEGARVSELATESEVFVVVVVLETAEPEDAELADLKSVGGRRETRGEEAVVVSLGGHFCEEAHRWRSWGLRILGGFEMKEEREWGQRGGDSESEIEI